MSAPASRSPAPAVPWPTAMLGGALGALAAPGSWPVALAGFLARGGLILFLVPIVVVPTPAGVANVVAPWLVPFVFGQVSAEAVVILGLTAAGILGWIVAGGLLGAWADVVLIRDASANEELGFGPIAAPPRRRLNRQAFVVRLLAHAPLGIALAWGAARIGQAGYQELVNPLEVVSPLVVRIVSDVPDAVAAVLIAWLIGAAASPCATWSSAGPRPPAACARPISISSATPRLSPRSDSRRSGCSSRWSRRSWPPGSDGPGSG